MRETSARAVLQALNDALVRQATTDRFCTAVYVRLEPGAHGVHVTSSRAGHPYPLVVRADGTVEMLGDDVGMLLGVFEDVALSESSTLLAPGDALVAYTDGLVEARQDGGERYGVERLVAELARTAGRPASYIAGRLEASVLAEHRGLPEDDLAIVVVAVPRLSTTD
jgi:sigma-B regulation protein RsbU (phosphoserine phosphatase)